MSEPMLVKKFELKVWPVDGEPFTIGGEGEIKMNLMQEMPAQFAFEPGRMSATEVVHTGDMIVQMDARWVHKGLWRKFQSFVARGFRMEG